MLSFWSGTAVDCIWQYLVKIEPEELLVARERQIMALARYGRQNVLQWADTEVGEIRRWYERLKELLDAENKFTRTEEEQ